jgi:GNAT superfamily N-acetyltransferase
MIESMTKATSNGTVNVRPVLSQHDQKVFLDVPHTLYGKDSNWVAPLYFERHEHLNPKKNPYFDHADTQLFVAEKNGKPVGRISAQIDKLHLERYKDATGQFGFLEATDDAQVFAALFETAEKWLKSRNIKRVRGPFSFSINDEMGLLIDGFDTPPNMLMGHALPYYQKQIEARGFTKAKDVIAYFLDNHDPLPRSMAAAYERAMKSPHIEVRPLDKKNLARDLDIILSIHTDAWSDNWGFVPFTAKELKVLGDNLKILVSREYIAIASYKGVPAAFAVTLPNINDWITGLGGKLLPFGWAKVMWNLFARPPKSVRMPLMGVRREFHGTLTGSSLALAVIETVRRYHISRGTRNGELSWILEDNMPMRHILEALGARPYKTYRIYEKSL